MKRLTCVLLMLVMTAMLLSGCGSQGGKEANTAVNAGQQAAEPKAEAKEKVVVACWGNQMLDS